jgi:acyl dehydratase
MLSAEHIGVEDAGIVRSWTSRDAMLYALGVGAGSGAPETELDFTTENSAGVVPAVLPTFPTVLGAGLPDIGPFELRHLLHVGHGVRLHRQLPRDGAVRASKVLDGLDQKRTGVIVRTRTLLRDNESGSLLAEIAGEYLIRGERVAPSPAIPPFGDKAPGAPAWTLPERHPDAVVEYATRPEQALIYRLSGDRNPLHSDPAFARAAGFDRPILHGLCTFGFTGRAVLHAFAGSDPTRLRSFAGRFTRPVFPGDRLTVDIWVDGGTARFRTSTQDGTVVLDRGTAHLA